MNDGRLDRALLLAILAALGGLYWQMFSMNERFSDDIAGLSSDIAEVSQRLSSDMADVSERLARGETHLEYIGPRPADPVPEQSPIN